MLFFELDENFTVRGTVFQRIVEKNVEHLFEMCGTALYPHIICDLVVQCQSLFKIQRDMTLQAVVNTYGTALVVAYGVCLKVEYMRIFAPFLIGAGILTLFHNLLRAVGDVKITICMGISEVITRIGFAFLFSYLWGYHGLWFVSPLTWCCAAMVGAARYLSGTWKRKLDQMEMVQDI